MTKREEVRNYIRRKEAVQRYKIEENFHYPNTQLNRLKIGDSNVTKAKIHWSSHNVEYGKADIFEHPTRRVYYYIDTERGRRALGNALINNMIIDLNLDIPTGMKRSLTHSLNNSGLPKDTIKYIRSKFVE